LTCGLSGEPVCYRMLSLITHTEIAIDLLHFRSRLGSPYHYIAESIDNVPPYLKLFDFELQLYHLIGYLYIYVPGQPHVMYISSIRIEIWLQYSYIDGPYRAIQTRIPVDHRMGTQNLLFLVYIIDI